MDMLARLGSVIGLYTAAELTLACGVVLLALWNPRALTVAGEWVERHLAPLAHRPVGQILAVGALAVLARAAFLPWLGAPVPLVHDEQSLLLQAQTFVAGRLANPPHPFWEHFETFHVNQLPAYASMYFPGRGAPLAAGLALAGEPWLGVWLSFVLMAMAAVWMLQAWVSLPMALLGGTLVVLRLGIFSYWINSYWGGAFTALGAMLVFGAVPRLLREPRWSMGLLMGLGTLILMTTRPYEGALVCLAVTGLLLSRAVRGGWSRQGAMLVRAAVPVTLFVAAGGALLLAYNAATTGHMAKTPYDLNRETYATAPAFLVAKPVDSLQRGPEYFRAFYREEAVNHERRGSPAGIVRGAIGKVFHTWNFYIGAVFTLAFAAGLWCSRRERFLLAALGLFFAGYLLETWNFPHYTAPAFPLLLIFLMRGFAWLRTFNWRGREVGLALTRAMPAAAVVLLALPAGAVLSGKTSLLSNSHSQACCAITDEHIRSRLTRELLDRPGRDLVFIKVSQQPLHLEFVYNEPDIDAAPIVWARQVGEEADRRLMAHLSDRLVWEFEWRPDLPQGYQLRRLGDVDAVLGTNRAPRIAAPTDVR